MSNLSVIILAAGKGTRMKSSLPKVMHKVANREMLNLVIDEAKKMNPQEIAIVISKEFRDFQEQIIAAHKDVVINFVVQEQQNGTGGAALVGFGALEKKSENVIILYGDTPLISCESLNLMVEKLGDDVVCVLGFESEFENQYGRLVVGDNEKLLKIVEFKEASDDEKNISLCNSGVVGIQGAHIENLLADIKDDNLAGEFYLTDVVAIAGGKNLSCSFVATHEEEVLGVNSRLELSRVEDIRQNQMREKFMENGVTLLDPFSVYFSYDTEISRDVVIRQNVVFGEGVSVGEGCEIKSFCDIEGVKIAENAKIGPFARIRPGTEIGENVRIGNFVEVKKSVLKDGAKVNHLSYVGDSDIGSGANIGAGVVTCNYDGFNKSQTIIGDEVFIGSNSSLVAPINVEKGAMIGAGSVVTKNVARDELAVSRVLQKNIVDGARKYRNSKKK